MQPFHFPSQEGFTHLIQKLSSVSLDNNRIIIENTTSGILKMPSYTLSIGQKEWKIVTWFKRLFGVNKRVATLTEVLFFLKLNEGYLTSAQSEAINKLAPIFHKNDRLKEIFKRLTESLKNPVPEQPVAPEAKLLVDPTDELKLDELKTDIPLNDITAKQLSGKISELIRIPAAFEEFLTSYSEHCETILIKDPDNIHFKTSMDLVTEIQSRLKIVRDDLNEISLINLPWQKLIDLLKFFNSDNFYLYFQLLASLTMHEEICVNQHCMVELQSGDNMNIFECTLNNNSYLALNQLIQTPTRIPLIIRELSELTTSLLSNSQKKIEVQDYVSALNIIRQKLSQIIHTINETAKISSKREIDSPFRDFKAHLLIADHIFIDSLPSLTSDGKSIRDQHHKSAIKILNSQIEELDKLHQEKSDVMMDTKQQITEQDTKELDPNKRSFLKIGQDIQEKESILEKYLSFLNKKMRPNIKQAVRSQLPKAYQPLIKIK